MRLDLSGSIIKFIGDGLVVRVTYGTVSDRTKILPSNTLPNFVRQEVLSILGERDLYRIEIYLSTVSNTKLEDVKSALATNTLIGSVNYVLHYWDLSGMSQEQIELLNLPNELGNESGDVLKLGNFNLYAVETYVF